MQLNSKSVVGTVKPENCEEKDQFHNDPAEASFI